MAYTLDLSGPWAKLERAKKHIDDLRRQIAQAFPNGELFPLRQEFNREQGVFIVSIERVKKLPQEWGLIVGDAVHNLRCALDHLAWQLALRHFDGVEPPDRGIIKQIQFPVVVDKKDWVTHINRKHMVVTDADKLEEFQPFNLSPDRRAKGHRNALEDIAGFGGVDNVDKHRTIHLTYTLVERVAWMDNWNYRDCTPLDDGTGPGAGHIKFMLSDNPPKPGDEVYRVTVVPDGPNPQMDFKSSLTGYIAIREGWNVIDALDAFAGEVERVLRKF